MKILTQSILRKCSTLTLIKNLQPGPIILPNLMYPFFVTDFHTVTSFFNSYTVGTESFININFSIVAIKATEIWRPPCVFEKYKINKKIKEYLFWIQSISYHQVFGNVREYSLQQLLSSCMFLDTHRTENLIYFYLFLSFWNSAQELRTSRIFYLCLLRAWGNKSMSTGLFANWSRLIFIWTFINNVFWCHSVFDFIFIQWHISRTGIIDNFVALICFRVGMSILEITIY